MNVTTIITIQQLWHVTVSMKEWIMFRWTRAKSLLSPSTRRRKIKLFNRIGIRHKTHNHRWPGGNAAAIWRDISSNFLQFLILFESFINKHTDAYIVVHYDATISLHIFFRSPSWLVAAPLCGDVIVDWIKDSLFRVSRIKRVQLWRIRSFYEVVFVAITIMTYRAADVAWKGKVTRSLMQLNLCWEEEQQ